MSQYTHVFVRKNDAFIELSCTGGSCCMSEVFQDIAPYGRIRRVDKDTLSNLIHEWKHELGVWEKSLENKEKQIASIGAFNNSVEEKLEAINEIKNEIEEDKQSIDELRDTIAVLYFLLYSEQEVYVGVECGSKPTEKDIVE